MVLHKDLFLGLWIFALYVNELSSLISSKLLMFAEAPVNVAKCKVVHIGSAPYVGNYCLNETLLELFETLVYKLIQSLNFMFTQILSLKKLTVFGPYQ